MLCISLYIAVFAWNKIDETPNAYVNVFYLLSVKIIEKTIFILSIIIFSGFLSQQVCLRSSKLHVSSFKI